MGRKSKPSRAASEIGDDKASSTVSICGRSAANDDFDLYSDEEEDEFAVAIEMLYEKRAATRESGLQKLIRLLTTEWQYEECTFKQETLSRLFLSCFKRGGAAEAILATRALALHVITLGPTSATEEIFEEALTAFEPVIAKGKVADVRTAAIEALSMMCFVAAAGPDETMQVMSLLRRASSSSTGEVQATALRGWTLLFTTVPAWKFASTALDEQLKLLAALLHSDNVDVRAAAGEAVAVLYDTCDLSTLPESTPAATEEEEEEVDHIEDIVSRMQDLAKNRGDETRRSKKDRVVLKTTFRELASIMEGGDPPEQKVKLRHGDVLIVDTLIGNVQLNAFRSFLGEGFQVHLLSNILLHQIFSFRPSGEAPERLTALEKRAYRSPASAVSKERSQTRKNERRASAANKNTLMY